MFTDRYIMTYLNFVHNRKKKYFAIVQKKPKNTGSIKTINVAVCKN